MEESLDGEEEGGGARDSRGFQSVFFPPSPKTRKDPSRPRSFHPQNWILSSIVNERIDQPRRRPPPPRLLKKSNRGDTGLPKNDLEKKTGGGRK